MAQRGRKLAIREPLDVFEIHRATRVLAKELGFARHACQELVIVASELASNVLKYGKPGSFELAELSDARGRGMELTARDCGPPFRDLESAMRDGYDDTGPIDPAHILKRGGFGGGIGAIVRLSHSFRVEPHPGGKRVIAIRYL